MDGNGRRVVAALQTIRVRKMGDEVGGLHPLVKQALEIANIPFKQEFRVDQHSRLDFLAFETVVIEVKRDCPKPRLYRQLAKYASLDIATEIVLVSERSVQLPATINGKPVHTVSLNALWGIAL